jgi:hypothetical protein
VLFRTAVLMPLAGVPTVLAPLAKVNLIQVVVTPIARCEFLVTRHLFARLGIIPFRPNARDVIIYDSRLASH